MLKGAKMRMIKLLPYDALLLKNRRFGIFLPVVLKMANKYRRCTRKYTSMHPSFWKIGSDIKKV
jgi:hypothetical protein